MTEEDRNKRNTTRLTELFPAFRAQLPARQDPSSQPVQRDLQACRGGIGGDRHQQSAGPLDPEHDRLGLRLGPCDRAGRCYRALSITR